MSIHSKSDLDLVNRTELAELFGRKVDLVPPKGLKAAIRPHAALGNVPPYEYAPKQS